MKNFISVIIICLVPVIAGQNVYAGPIIVGYYPSWMRASLPAEKVQFENLTHIHHAFAWPEPDGSISTYLNFVYPQLIEKTHAAGKKILVALGGWGQSSGFSPMAANPTARANFILTIINFCWLHGYDGVDLDWEHPANATDRKNLVTLVQELRTAFEDQDSTLLLSMAITAGPYSGQWIDYPALKNNIDWFGCMTYDFHGSWSGHAGHNSPLYAPANDHCGSVHTGVQYLNSTRGVPKEKILIGLPFYGREFTATQLYGASSDGDLTFNYNEIIPKIGTAWFYHWDDFSKVPYLTNTSHTKLITFDDTLSIRYKCEYARNQQLHGIMIWSLGQDVMGTSQPLLETVARAMAIPTDTNNSVSLNARSFQLLNNYPNPFNEFTIISFHLAKEEKVKLEIVNTSGQQLAILINEWGTIGWHRQRFSAQGLPSGVYFYRLTSESLAKTGKMVLVK